MATWTAAGSVHAALREPEDGRRLPPHSPPCSAGRPAAPGAADGERPAPLVHVWDPGQQHRVPAHVDGVHVPALVPAGGPHRPQPGRTPEGHGLAAADVPAHVREGAGQASRPVAHPRGGLRTTGRLLSGRHRPWPTGRAHPAPRTSWDARRRDRSSHRRSGPTGARHRLDREGAPSARSPLGAGRSPSVFGSCAADGGCRAYQRVRTAMSRPVWCRRPVMHASAATDGTVRRQC